MENAQQLDLFEDSALHQALREFALALAQARAADAAVLLARARELAGRRHPRLLDDARQLLELLEDSTPLLKDPERGLEAVHTQHRPRAQALLGAAAAPFERILLTRIAQAMDARGYISGRDSVHPASVWLALGEPAQAHASVSRDLFWRGCPVRLAWHARACEALHDPAAAQRSWIELCLIDPRHAERELPHSTLDADWDAFCDLDPALATEWFPLWRVLCCDQPACMPQLERPAVDAAACALLQALLTPGIRADIGFRTRLQAANPALLRHWLQPGRAS